MQNQLQSPLKHLMINGDKSPLDVNDDFDLSSSSSLQNLSGQLGQSGRKNSDEQYPIKRRKFRSQDFTEQLYMWNDYLVRKFEAKQL